MALEVGVLSAVKVKRVFRPWREAQGEGGVRRKTCREKKNDWVGGKKAHSGYRCDNYKSRGGGQTGKTSGINGVQGLARYKEKEDKTPGRKNSWKCLNDGKRIM